MKTYTLCVGNSKNNIIFIIKMHVRLDNEMHNSVRCSNVLLLSPSLIKNNANGAFRHCLLTGKITNFNHRE